MSSKQPLLHDSIILTGTSITKRAQAQIEALGGQAIHLPLIETVEIKSDADARLLQQSQEADWIIFTSQNAVHAFANKMQAAQMTPSDWANKIAVVGTKTAEALEKVGFTISFTSTIFSADMMVKEFNPLIEADTSCFFIKGTMAKNTIEEGLHCPVTTWTIYETIETDAHIAELIQLVKKQHCTVIFASPSAVNIYAKEVVPFVPWQQINIAAIGHITEHALKQYGVEQIIQPQQYTMTKVIEEIANRKEL